MLQCANKSEGRKKMHGNGKKRWWLMLPLLAGLLTGCAAKSPVYDAACPLPPQKPIAARPMPPSTYSSSAQTNIERWHKQLISTQAMP